MIKKKVSFKTISPVILSPRMAGALYKGIDFREVTANERIQIIYPFYSYCDRNLKGDMQFELAADYYIPASSLKGALLGKETATGEQNETRFRSQIRFQNIAINSTDITLENIYKFQYLYQNEMGDGKEGGHSETAYKKPKLDIFFPMVQMEMLKAESEFHGEILLETDENYFKKSMEISCKNTIKKIKNYIAEIDDRVSKIKHWKRVETEEICHELSCIKENLSKHTEQENLIFLGGYKGLLCGLNELNKEKDVQNGFYIDNKTLIPYGLVRVRIE